MKNALEGLGKVDTAPANCEAHGEFTAKFIPMGRGGIWTRCPTCVEGAKAETKRQEEAELSRVRQQRLEQRLDTAGIPARFRTRTFDNFEAESKDQRHALKVAREFAAGFQHHLESGTTAVFSGSPGTGKNHLAMAIGQHLMSAGRTVMALTVREAVMRMRASYRNGDAPSELEVLTTLSRVDLLILDEVGVQSGTDFEHDQVFTLIDMRYREAKPMLFLTNLPKPAFAEALGPRAFDRLQEAWLWVPFAWDSWRKRV